MTVDDIGLLFGDLELRFKESVKPGNYTFASHSILQNGITVEITFDAKSVSHAVYVRNLLNKKNSKYEIIEIRLYRKGNVLATIVT